MGKGNWVQVHHKRLIQEKVTRRRLCKCKHILEAHWLQLHPRIRCWSVLANKWLANQHHVRVRSIASIGHLGPTSRGSHQSLQRYGASWVWSPFWSRWWNQTWQNSLQQGQSLIRLLTTGLVRTTNIWFKFRLWVMSRNRWGSCRQKCY